MKATIEYIPQIHLILSLREAYYLKGITQNSSPDEIDTPIKRKIFDKLPSFEQMTDLFEDEYKQ